MGYSYIDYSYTYGDNMDLPTYAGGPYGIEGLALFGLFLVFVLFFALIFYAISAFLLGKLFQKAGEPQWIAWVPIYNTWKILELGGQQGFWAILGFIPFVNIIALIYLYVAMYYIGKKLGKEDWFVLLAIFVPIIWLIWLGYDDSKWPKSSNKSSK